MSYHVKRAEMVVLALLVGLILLAAPGYEVRYFSCEDCRIRKQIKITRFCFINVHTAETTEAASPLISGHQHKWRHYASYESQGLGGWLYQAGSATNTEAGGPPGQTAQ